jgi:hypothetical protein
MRRAVILCEGGAPRVKSDDHDPEQYTQHPYPEEPKASAAVGRVGTEFF